VHFLHVVVLFYRHKILCKRSLISKYGKNIINIIGFKYGTILVFILSELLKTEVHNEKDDFNISSFILV